MNPESAHLRRHPHSVLFPVHGVKGLRRLSQRDRIPCLPAWPGVNLPRNMQGMVLLQPCHLPNESRKIPKKFHGISYTSQRPLDKYYQPKPPMIFFPGESLRITAHLGLIFHVDMVNSLSPMGSSKCYTTPVNPTNHHQSLAVPTT